MNLTKFCEIVGKTAKFEIGEVQKNAYLVDLEKKAEKMRLLSLS